MSLFKREATTASAPAATFFDATPHEDASAITKPVRDRKMRPKGIPAGSQPVQAVDQREPLQTEVEHPRENLMRMLQRAESGQRDEQPTSATRTATFRRPGLRNSIGLLSNGPVHFSTHGPDEYETLYAESIAAERAEAKATQERRAWAGLERLMQMLTPACIKDS